MDKVNIHNALREDSEQRSAIYLNTDNNFAWKTKKRMSYLIYNIIIIFISAIIILIASLFLNPLALKLSCIFLCIVCIMQYGYCLFKKREIIFDFLENKIIIKEKNKIEKIPFAQVKAIQNVANCFLPPGGASGYAEFPERHQLNLVLDDYNRIKVIDKGSRWYITEITEKLSTAMNKENWQETNHYDNLSIKRSRFIVYFFWGISSILGGSISLMCLYNILSIFLIQWTTVPARIITLSEDKVIYSYSYMGTSYQSGKTNFFNDNRNGLKDPDYKKNHALTCYVNAAKPTEAILTFAFPQQFYYKLGIGMLLFLVGIVGMLKFHFSIKDALLYQNTLSRNKLLK